MSKSAGTAVTKEHGFPLWLLPWLGHDDEPSKGVTHTIREALDGPVLCEWTTDELDIVARKVCEPCNGGWMNDLENMARPHLIPLMEGKLRVLDAPAQRIVAAWAVKTALSLSLANAATQPIAMEHYRAMARLKRRPPPKTHVWLAAYRGWRNAFHYENTLTFTGAHGQRR